jgi:acyl-CoA thioester hydrolase
MAVRQLRAASFTIDYDLHDGPDEDSPVAVVGVTRMAMVDLDAQHPRRLSPDERAFLQRWADTPAVVS